LTWAASYFSADIFPFINHQSSIINHQSSIINHQSSIINHQSSIINAGCAPAFKAGLCAQFPHKKAQTGV